MDITPDVFLESLSSVRWNIATKAYGSHHATLIGLLVDWWITQCPEKNWVLEGGPGNGFSEPGKRGQCDALFCSGEVPVGVLEVEGSRIIETINKLGTFFEAKTNIKEYETLGFGLLLFYSYEPIGRGDMRHFEPAFSQEIENVIKDISSLHKDVPIYVISIDKSYNRISNGVRSFNDYYKGSVKTITGMCFVGKNSVQKKHFYCAS